VRYAVRGRNVHQLRDEMTRIGPIDDGRHQFAHTWGTYAWRYPFEKTPAGCLTGNVHVEFELVQTLPEWLDRAGASRATRDEWDRWLAATTAHEEGHRQILLAAAKKMADALSAVPARPTCGELDEAANGLGVELLQRMRAEHAAYDRETQHGKRTGASLREDLP
jgi:predicted secreted Zn-dependent protease